MTAGSGFGEDLRGTLERRQREVLRVEGFRSAAVLVPILASSQGAELLFTLRSSDLSNHAGQVAFPGGRLDDGESIEEAAARETHEEIGVRVPPEALLGRLDDNLSPALYVVTPVVALLPWPQSLTINPTEVDEVFTVPLPRLQALTPRTEERQLRDVRRTLHYYDVDERTIWGLTGNIVKNLIDVLAHVPKGAT